MSIRTVVYGGIEYDVMFDGVNDGKGGDLLSDGLKAARTTPKAAPTSTRALKGEHLEKVMAVLALATRWLTMRELADLSQLPIASVGSQLYQRVGDGRIARTVFPIAISSHGNPECGYALPGKFVDDSAPITTKRTRYTMRDQQKRCKDCQKKYAQEMGLCRTCQSIRSGVTPIRGRRRNTILGVG